MIKKNNNIQSKTTSGHQKSLKKSKSHDILNNKKSHKRNIESQSTNKFTEDHSLSKSKSAKSLKVKTKKSMKISENPDQVKTKKIIENKASCKTIKKLKQHPQSTISQTWTQKPHAAQYFLYHNNYIPIQNSAQRRLVLKIQMIDLENKSTTSSFSKSPTQSRGVQTYQIQKKQTSVGDSNVKINNLEVQTEPIRFKQQAQKCFSDLLTELQFLHLPCQASFQSFTNQQRTHYSQLLQIVAQKILKNKKQIQITLLLFQRQGIQIGAIQFIANSGFPTHVPSIVAYLKNLFCYLQFAYKEQLIGGLRQFYGLGFSQRIARLGKHLPHVTQQKPILTNSVFQSFQHQMFKDYDFGDQTVKMSVHTHNLAIFDALNEELQKFRPFYSSQGQPFPWTTNLGMTHYDITEEAMFIILIQIKQKIQKYLFNLCGMHLDVEEDVENINKNIFYQKRMEQRNEKMIKQEIKQIDDRVEMDYMTSRIYFQISDHLMESIIMEMAFDMKKVGISNQEQNQCFQYFN